MIGYSGALIATPFARAATRRAAGGESVVAARRAGLWRAVAATASALALVVGGVTAGATPATAATAPVPGNIVDGGELISDDAFFDSGSMTATAVQTFLDARVKTCRAARGAPACLKSFTADLPATSADAYCGAITKKTKARASAIIVAVARACGISPKVILVMLQKEQGLVTSTAPSSWNYRAAMGQSCPDDAPCSAAAAGFVNQVRLGARQLQIYTKKPGSFTYRAGVVNTVRWHPDASCGTSKVFIRNQATANLYNYTPYRPNISALAAGYGSGDPCSSYGNRNFFNYYVDWFAKDAKTTTGAPAAVSACRTPVKADVAPARGIAVVRLNDTRVRTAPSTMCGSRMTSAPRGTMYGVTGTYAGWLRLQSASGQTLWTFGTNAAYVRTPTVGTTPVPLPMPGPGQGQTGPAKPVPPKP